jgi:long-chain fatty acid transport protein
MRHLALALVLLPSLARAGGFEIIEQSPAGTGMVGARTAVGDGPDTIFYNPAGLTFVRGLNVEAGVIVMNTAVHIAAPDGSPNGGGTFGLPTVYLTQRLGPYFGLGIGIFSNFADQLTYPEPYAALHPGFVQTFSLRTTTFAPSVAFRPLRWLSFGLGIDLLTASLDLAVGGPVGTLTPASMTAFGSSANLGIIVEPVRRWLRLAATYRGPIDLDFTGSGYAQYSAATTMPLPHNFTFAASSRPLEKLTVDLEAHVALSSDLHTLLVTYSDPANAKDKPAIAIDTNQRDAWGVRGGAEYRLADDKWRVRLGLGYDSSPVRRGWLGPIQPDSQRVVVGVGFGGTFGDVAVDFGYSAQVVLSRTSSNPVPGMTTYDTLRHLLALSISLKLPNLGPRVDIPEYKH